MEEAWRPLASTSAGLHLVDNSKAWRMMASDPAWLRAFKQVLDSDPQNKFVQVATVSSAAGDTAYLFHNTNTVCFVIMSDMLSMHHCKHHHALTTSRATSCQNYDILHDSQRQVKCR